ncbi:nucleoporin Nup186/Nup192/Nup205 [Gongronella butleri]|nr:nucleoporin Nup186/Nup192/Nup205 [Gongronella butleri]
MTTTDGRPTWPSEASTLHALLLRAQQLPSAPLLSTVANELDRYKPIFLNLLDDHAKDPAHRKELNAGEAYIDGVKHAVKSEFATRALFLSDELDINEHAASTLLFYAISRAKSEGTTETRAAMELYHDQRAYLLLSLEWVLKACRDNEIDPTLRQMCLAYASDLLKDTAIPCRNEKSGTFASKLILTAKRLNTISKRLESTNSAVAPATAAPPPPTSQPGSTLQQPAQALQGSTQQQQQQQTSTQGQQGQGPQQAPKMTDDEVQFRVQRLNEERLHLLELLYHVARVSWLDASDLGELVDRVAKATLGAATTANLLTALLGALTFDKDKVGTPYTEQGSSLIATIHDKIRTSAAAAAATTWKVPVVHATVALQWAAFLQHVPSPAFNTQVDDAQVLATELAGKCAVFAFLNHFLLPFRRSPAAMVAYEKYHSNDDMDDRNDDNLEDGDDEEALLLGTKTPNNGLMAKSMNNAVNGGLIVDPTDYTKFTATIRADFQTHILHTIQTLTTTIIKNMMKLLQDLALQEEDVVDDIDRRQYQNYAIFADDDDNDNFNDTTMPRSLLSPPSAVSPPPSSSNAPERHEQIASFLSLLANIYRDRRNEAVWLWTQEEQGTDEQSFLKWLVETAKTSATQLPALDFMAAMACGDEAAAHAHRYLELGTDTDDLDSSRFFSWGKLFAALRYFCAKVQRDTYIGMDDQAQLAMFLQLLEHVVQYCRDARVALWNHTVYQPRDYLTMLANKPITPSLRVSLCNVLAAFCSAWGGGIDDVGRNISLQVWPLLQQGDVFILHPNDKNKMGKKDKPKDITGLMQELALNRADRSYAETLSILQLLASMIHRPSKWDQLQSGFAALPLSIPLHLGKESRTPGAQPYIAAVIDQVLLVWQDLQLQKRAFERWQLADTCLRIFENSLASLDLGPLVDAIHQWQQSPVYKQDMDKALAFYVVHPAFDLMLRLLAGGREIQQIFHMIHRAKLLLFKENDPVVATRANDATQRLFKYAARTATRALRILHIVATQQELFANFFLPRVRHQATKLYTGKLRLGDVTLSPWPHLQPLASHMLYNKTILLDLAGLLNCGAHEEICYLSVKLLHGVTNEPNQPVVPLPPYAQNKPEDQLTRPFGGLGTRVLAEILSSDRAFALTLQSTISERITIEKAEQTTYDDYEYDMANIPFWKAARVLGDKQLLGNDFDQPEMTTSVRLAILEWLLSSADAPAPNVTGLILGLDAATNASVSSLFPTKQQTSLPQEPSSTSTSLVCFHTILDLLKANLMDMDLPSEDHDDAKLLSSTHPVLAERCYTLLHRLCAHPTWSPWIVAHLRIPDDYFYHQLHSLLGRMAAKPLANAAPSIELCVAPGKIIRPLADPLPWLKKSKMDDENGETRADALALKSVLHQYAAQLDAIAVELHTLPNASKKDAARLIRLLFADDGTDISMENVATYAKFLELPALLDFTWQDDLEADALAYMGAASMNNNDNMVPSTPSTPFVTATTTPPAPTTTLSPAASSTILSQQQQQQQQQQPQFVHVYFKDDFNAAIYQTSSPSGCKVFDIRLIYSHMRNAQRDMQDKGILTTNDDHYACEREMGAILALCMAKNHENEVRFAQEHCFDAWLHVLQIALLDNFDLLPRDGCLTILAHLISNLLPIVDRRRAAASSSSIPTDTWTLGMARTLLLLMTRLRASYQNQQNDQNNKKKQNHIDIHRKNNILTTSDLPQLCRQLEVIFDHLTRLLQSENLTHTVKKTLYAATIHLVRVVALNKDMLNVVQAMKNTLVDLHFDTTTAST